MSIRSMSYMAAASLSALAAASPAIAQEQGDQIDETVVVTARARAENVQKVPDSISVLGADTIEAAGIRSVDDATIFIPNFSLVDAQDAGTVALTIRGIGQVRNGEAPVAIVVDGVQLNSPDMIKQSLFDVERIEVLKGPQGALYGRNAIGGAINITTKVPDNELGGRVSAEYANGDDISIGGAISGAIVPDILRFRIAADYRDFGGVLSNVTLDRKVDFIEDFNLRARLIFTPADNLTIDLRGTHARLDGGASWYIPLPDNDPNNTNVPIVADVLGHSSRDFDDAALKVEYDFGALTFSSISAYANTDLDLDEDLDWTSAAILGVYQRRQLETLTQEFRLTSPSSQRLRWTAGAFYLDGTRKIDSIFLLSPDATASGLPLSDYFPIPIARTTEDMKTHAIYAQINYDLTDAIELTAALRYDHDKRTQADRLGATDDRSASFDSWQPKLSLNYKLNSDSIVYATLAKGFRSGGFNAPNGAFPLVYKPEITKGVEIGTKNTWLDGRLTFNAAAFYNRFENQQVFILKLANQGLVNVAKTDIWGLEIDSRFKASEHIEIGASLGLLDTKVKDFDGTSLYRGNKVPLTYSWSYTAWGQITQPIGDAELILRADYTGKGGNYWHIDNLDKQDDVHLVNARLTLDFGSYSLALFAKNLFNVDYTEEFFSKDFSGGGTDIRYPGSPRRYGIAATLKF